MLTRVLEPEVMDSAEEAHDYDSMDHSNVNRAFVDDFLAFAGAAPDGPILDLGTGSALIPLELCRRTREVQVTAVDLAACMLDLARANLVRANLRDRIRLELIDAKGLPYADDAFAAVISNSIVHHIPEPRPALAEAVRVTRPGGLLFIRDLLRPSTESEAEALVERYAGRDTPRQRALFAASLRAALSLDEIRTIVAEIGYLAESVHATSDRHWTFAARRPGPK